MTTKILKLSEDELRQIMPLLSAAKRRSYLPFLQAAMDEFGVSESVRRMSAFLAQLAHESAQLKYFEEIASGAAYEGRKDLGNTVRGDGRRYKGRGPIQLTGRANYRRYGALLGLPLEDDPELAATLDCGFRIAGLYWKLNGLNALADGLTLKGDRRDEQVFKLITKRINGGYNGLSDRMMYFRRAKVVLSKREGHPVTATAASQIEEALQLAVAPAARPASPSEMVPPTVSPAPATALPAEPSLLDELPSVPSSAAASVGKRAATRAAWLGAKLWTALEAGSYLQLSVYAVVLIALALVVWHYRKAISANWRKLLRKVKFGE